MSGFLVLTQIGAMLFDRQLKCRMKAALCAGLELTGVGVGLFGPLLLKDLVDRLSAGVTPLWYLCGLVLAFVVAWTAPSLLAPVRAVCSAAITGALVITITTNGLRGAFSGRTDLDGDSSSRLGRLEKLSSSLAVVMEGLIWRIPSLILQFGLTMVVVLTAMSWRYLCVLAGVALGFVVVSWSSAIQQAVLANELNSLSASNAGLLGDILRNQERVVCNGAIEFEVGNVQASLTGRVGAEVAFSRALAGLSAAQFLVTTIGVTVLLVMGVLDITRHILSAGDFVLLQAYGLRLALPLSGVGYILNQSTAALRNIADVLAMGKRECPGRTEQTSPAAGYGRPPSIDVHGLTFSYGASRMAVRQISFTLKPGSFTAIVGKNGSGKSTLAKLLAGRLTPDAGTIHFNGVPLASVTPDQRHQVVLYVPQRAALLNRTLRDNLTYPPSGRQAEDARQVLNDWSFYPDRRPIDLDGNVGEGGGNLSGGQVQKLELARIIGLKMSCLVLDESTSAMDPISVSAVVRSLQADGANPSTIVFVTHDAAIARQADTVIWLSEGKMSDVGTHHDLLRQHPDYRDMWLEVEG